VIKTLVNAGVDVNARSKNGTTPLMHAAQKNRPVAIITLLDLGADPKATDDTGKTAIDFARENVRLKGTKALRKLEKMSY
jgi:ankyrin repeat protein